MTLGFESGKMRYQSLVACNHRDYNTDMDQAKTYVPISSIWDHLQKKAPKYGKHKISNKRGNTY